MPCKIHTRHVTWYIQLAQQCTLIVDTQQDTIEHIM